MEFWNPPEAQWLSAIIAKFLLVRDFLQEAIDLCNFHHDDSLLDLTQLLLIVADYVLNRRDSLTRLLPHFLSMARRIPNFCCAYAVVHEDADHSGFLFVLLLLVLIDT